MKTNQKKIPFLEKELIENKKQGSIIGKNGQIDHQFPVQIDHQFRSKLTT